MPKITFEYIGDYASQVCERPTPSSDYIPKWYKEMNSYEDHDEVAANNRLIVSGGQSNATAKKCVPMLDGIMSGYTVPLWADVQVRQSKNQEGDLPLINWRTQKDIFQLHGASSRGIEPPPGYDNLVFKYIPWFKIKTPPGYSVLVRPPAGHYNLPFLAIPAIIDTDRSVIDSNFPVWIRSDLEGIVEKGTPIAQIFPFKRENWSSEFSVVSETQHFIEQDAGFYKTIKNNYIKNIWSKKTFR
jgi:hypothetical protein